MQTMTDSNADIGDTTEASCRAHMVALFLNESRDDVSGEQWRDFLHKHQGQQECDGLPLFDFGPEVLSKWEDSDESDALPKLSPVPFPDPIADLY